MNESDFPLPPQFDSIAAVLLAGGQGSRIGGNKPAVIYQGRSLLEWSFDLLRNLPLDDGRKFIAVGYSLDRFIINNPRVYGDSVKSPPSFNLVEDGYENHGPLAGIYAAFERSECHDCDWLFVMPVDMPHLPLDIVQKLIAAYRPGCQIIRAASIERSFPTLALIARNLDSHLRGFLADGGRKIFDFQNQFRHIEARVLSHGESLNINRASDLD